jgi:arylformamidase
MIHDITRVLSEATAVWPGDEPVRLSRGAPPGAQGAANTGSLSASLHAGTHLDAPAHLLPEGVGVDHVPLEACLGEALVVDCGEAHVIDTAILAPRVPRGTRRLLLRTRASARPDDRWDEAFPFLTPELAAWLVERGLVLLGVDSPSVDPADSSALTVHRLLLGAGVVILENLALADVTPGTFELAALPLRLEGMDGSPVRAVLRSP